MLYRYPDKIRHPDVIEAREKAHAPFNRLWWEHHMTKEQAYQWLATTMKVPQEEAHIGRFNIEQCEKVAQLAEKKLNAMRAQRPR